MGKWVKRRHQIIQSIAYPFFKLVLDIKLDYHYDKMRINRKNPHVILYNHQTLYDQFICGFSFRGPLYYVATEDITSNGIISKLLKFSVNVIPFKKSTNDINAVKTCLKVIKEGGSIAISPEGNRTYSGETCYMKASIVKLIKKMKVPVAFYKITGGYGVLPRWAEHPRKGHMDFSISRIMQYEEYKDLSNEEFYELIKKELYVNEQETKGIYESKKKAENLERAIYVCPKCGISEFESNGNTFKCKNCGLETTYQNDKTFKDSLPFNNVTDWYHYQEDFINNLDLNQFGNNPIFENVVKYKLVVPYKHKFNLFKKCTIKAYNDHFEIISLDKNPTKKAKEMNLDGKISLEYKDLLAMSVLGKNKMNYYYNNQIFQIRSDVHFNALKYVNIYYHYRNVMNIKTEEEIDDSWKFLGL